MTTDRSDANSALPAGFAATRDSMHRLAEHVLAATLYQSTGRIGLRVVPGGFGTPRFEHNGVERQLRIEGVDLVVVDGALERRAELKSIAQVADFVGIEPGGPAEAYSLATPLDFDADLVVDAQSAAILHDWLAVAAEALERFRSNNEDFEPSIAQLWPEHFDVAISMADVNYGGSPGDPWHDPPYAYVGPWQPDRVSGEFWNAPFGASRSHVDCPTPAAIVEFFETGRQLASGRSGILDA